MSRGRPGVCRACHGLGWLACGRRGHNRQRFACRKCVTCTACDGAGIVVVPAESVERYTTAYRERFGVTPRDVPATIR